MRKHARLSQFSQWVLLLVFSLGATATAFAAKPSTFAEALALATKENKVVIADFYTDW